jgi:hypothetical protein
MKNQEIFDFITTNTVDDLKEYNKRLTDKLDDISGRMNTISMWMILCVIVYFLFSASMISSVDVGFMTLTKLDVVPMILPWLFAMITLYFLILNNHFYELLQTSKIISFSIYNNPDLNELDYLMGYNNDYVRLAQPFSPWVEMQKWQHRARYSKFEAFLVAPLSLLMLFPPIFEFIMVERLFTKYWNYGFAKWSAAFSIWISIYCVFWVIRGFKAGAADLKAGVLPQPAAPPTQDIAIPQTDSNNVPPINDVPPPPENI